MRRSIFPSIYIAIGVVLAINYGYATLTSISGLLSFMLAVLLWPALLLNLSLHVNLGI